MDLFWVKNYGPTSVADILGRAVFEAYRTGINENSLGGHSGVYVGPDGVEYTFASEMSQPGETQYRMVSRYLAGEALREIWTRNFDRG